MRIIERLGIALIVILFIALIGGCIRWRWSECRQVGHGVAYCVWDMGRN